MTSRSWLLSIRAAAPLAAVFLLTGAIEVSCAGDPRDPGDPGGGSTRPDSHAMGQWTPVAGVDTCTQAEHDEHFVIGPDGKKYPAWHAATRTRSDNTTCSYGHEHGVSPGGLGGFYTEIKRHFAWDANNNGAIEQSELDAAGIPFGYVAEQLDGYNTADGTGTAGQRHQPHTAYKIAVATFADRDRTAGGVVTANYVNCAHLVVINQDTVTIDAFASNLHEAIVGLDCTATANSPYPVRVIASGMMSFGTRGQFDAAALAAAVPQPITAAGALPTSQLAGATGLRRAIPANTAGANRLSDNAFVAAGATVPSLDAAIGERWAAEFFLLNAGGTAIATVRPTVTALQPGRYYEPSLTGLAGRTVDLCYSGQNAGGGYVNDPALAGTIVRQIRGNADCDLVGAEAGRTATALASRVRFDATTSPFRNCIRRVDFGNVNLANAAGATTVYSDPFGRAAQSARSNTSNVKQYVAGVATAQLPAGSVDLVSKDLGVTSTCVAVLHLPN